MIKEILDIVSNYGAPSVVIIIIIIGLWKLLTVYLNNGLKNLFSGKKDNVKSEEYPELRHHLFFANTQYKMMIEIPALEICPDKPVKDQIFKDLMIIETKIIFDICMELAIIDMSDWTSDKWAAEVAKKTSDMITLFFTKSREAGIPELVIQKYTRWHTNNYETLHDYISVLSSSIAYDDNYSRTNTLLLIMNLLLITTIADAEKSLKEINGQLAGMKYKNMIIED